MPRAAASWMGKLLEAVTSAGPRGYSRQCGTDRLTHGQRPYAKSDLFCLAQVGERVHIPFQPRNTRQIEFGDTRLAMTHSRLGAELRAERGSWLRRVQRGPGARGVGHERLSHRRCRRERGL